MTRGDGGVHSLRPARRAGAVGHGGHYHSQSPEAFFCHMPGIKVCVPSGPADAYALLKAAHADPDPVIVMEPKQLYRTAVEEVVVGRPGDASTIGTARVARAGTDVTMVAWGQQVRLSHACCASSALLVAIARDAAVELSWSMPACAGSSMQTVWHRMHWSSSVRTRVGALWCVRVCETC